MIQLDNVTLSFADGDSRVIAVNELALTARAGTVTGITGPSGSGKSSLLAVAATLIRPDTGRVLIDGVDAARLTPAAASALRREQVGIVFQQSNLLPALTAHEQLTVMNELGQRGSRSGRKATAQRAQTCSTPSDWPATGTNARTSSPEGNVSGSISPAPS